MLLCLVGASKVEGKYNIEFENTYMPGLASLGTWGDSGNFDLSPAYCRSYNMVNIHAGLALRYRVCECFHLGIRPKRLTTTKNTNAWLARALSLSGEEKYSVTAAILPVFPGPTNTNGVLAVTVDAVWKEDGLGTSPCRRIGVDFAGTGTRIAARGTPT